MVRNKKLNDWLCVNFDDSKRGYVKIGDVLLVVGALITFTLFLLAMAYLAFSLLKSVVFAVVDGAKFLLAGSFFTDIMPTDAETLGIIIIGVGGIMIIIGVIIFILDTKIATCRYPEKRK